MPINQWQGGRVIPETASRFTLWTLRDLLSSILTHEINCSHLLSAQAQRATHTLQPRCAIVQRKKLRLAYSWYQKLRPERCPVPSLVHLHLSLDSAHH